MYFPELAIGLLLFASGFIASRAWMNLRDKSAARRLVAVIQIECRGIYKRIDELEALKKTLNSDASILLTEKPWLMHGLDSHLHWLATLVDELEVSSPHFLDYSSKQKMRRRR